MPSYVILALCRSTALELDLHSSSPSLVSELVTLGFSWTDHSAELTWIPSSAVGAIRIASHILDQVLQRTLVARLLALTQIRRHDGLVLWLDALWNVWPN